jgi:hypothetical protein
LRPGWISRYRHPRTEAASAPTWRCSIATPGIEIGVPQDPFDIAGPQIQGELVTSDDELSLVTVQRGIVQVTVVCLDAPGYIQAIGGAQDGNPTGKGAVNVGDAWDVTPQMCGQQANVDWNFTVARSGTDNVTFRFWGRTK